MNQAVAQFAPLVLIMVVFYFLIMRPQQKKFKAHQAMLAALKVGDKVVLAAGFKGKVTRVGEQFFTVDIGQGTKIEVEVERNAISAKGDGFVPTSRIGKARMRHFVLNSNRRLDHVPTRRAAYSRCRLPVLPGWEGFLPLLK
ncbi:preprotein translocase subunit YajC [Neisseria meningitidis]|nr:preprotein translocase subunit YajC [Neisseria meningitidis]